MTSRRLFDAREVEAKVAELATGMLALAPDPTRAALIGIRSRGAILAQRIQNLYKSERGISMPLGALDITLYRDDLSRGGFHPVVRGTDISFDIEGKTILLLDDVLFTGRTIRCALDEIVDFGRPKEVRLGVLVDRGGREYPIQPDFATVRQEVGSGEEIKVLLSETDGSDEIVLRRIA